MPNGGIHNSSSKAHLFTCSSQGCVLLVPVLERLANPYDALGKNAVLEGFVSRPFG